MVGISYVLMPPFRTDGSVFASGASVIDTWTDESSFFVARDASPSSRLPGNNEAMPIAYLLTWMPCPTQELMLSSETRIAVGKMLRHSTCGDELAVWFLRRGVSREYGVLQTSGKHLVNVKHAHDR